MGQGNPVDGPVAEDRPAEVADGRVHELVVEDGPKETADGPLA